jgi:hypothetical protein
MISRLTEVELIYPDCASSGPSCAAATLAQTNSGPVSSCSRTRQSLTSVRHCGSLNLCAELDERLAFVAAVSRSHFEHRTLREEHLECSRKRMML